MGGINHQPCRDYLQCSTAMSRTMSLAISTFFQANVCLEDVLLAELDGRQGYLRPVLDNLRLSSSYTDAFLMDLAALRALMKTNGYTDLPTLDSTDLEATGDKLVKQHAVCDTSWQKMTSKMLRGTFYANVDHFEALAKELKVKTDALFTKFVGIEDFAADGRINEILEENRPGNVKLEFAQLFTAWTDLLRDFLASSLLSTELWYAHSDAGSLVNSELTTAAT